MTSDLCNARQPGGIYRCEKPRGHVTAHGCDYIEDAQEYQIRWTNDRTKSKPSAPRAPLKRGKRPRAVSDKQGERTAFLHGIKAERLRQQHDLLGVYVCEGVCTFNTTDFVEAWEVLTVSHIISRNDTASRYERRREPNFRGDMPSNILLECVPCNQAREPQPEFGSAS